MAWKRLFEKKDPRTSPSGRPPAGPADSAPPTSSPGADRPPAQAAGDRPAAENRRVRVFVSSTFRDMAAERDELMSRAWPELRRACRERQVEFVEVDLRWGISEEQSTRRETLKLCLDEIRACRPFFIGLLGERYGWVPGGEVFTPDLEEEQPWVRELRDRSVTELEILHGVLNDPGMAGRAFFYFRDPAYAAGRGADYLAETPEAAARQAALKERIRAVCLERGIPLREGYAGPSALAEKVRADLQAAIDAQYPAESIPDALEREAREQEAFAEFRRRVYIGRPDYNEALDRHALARGGPMVVVGDSGSGKSALLANWVHDWRAAHPGHFVFQHYIGGTPGSAGHWGLLSRLLAEIKRWTGDAAALPVSHDDTLRDLPAWLASLRARAERDGVRAVVVLDALNQLEDRDGGGRLGWLPEESFAGSLRLIVSTLPGEALEAVERRGWPALRVEPLSADERRRMIERYLARFGKQLDGRRLNRLAAAPAAANPLYLKLLLDELRVTGTHERLDERLDRYLAAESIPALLDQILARYAQAYERDRPGLVGEVLALVWAARRGLSEPELLALLRPADLPQLPPALWAPLRAALDESLVDRGGILGFAHEFLRAAVERRYASGDDRKRALRLRLVGYFEAEPVTARACDELPWLLWQARDRDRLRACLLDMERFSEIQQRDQQELLGYWLWLGEVEAMGARYEAAFEAWQRGAGAGAEPRRVGQVANQLGLFLQHSGQYGHAAPLLRRALAIVEEVLGERYADTATSLDNLGVVLQAAGDLAGARPFHERALAIRREVLGERDLLTATSLNNLGSLLLNSGDLAGAQPYYERALAIRQEVLGERHPGTATSLNNLGMLLEAMGDQSGARPYLERALAIRQEVLGERHPETTVSLNNLGMLLKAMGDLSGARPYLERALAIRQEVLGERHPDTALSVHNLGSLLKAMGDLSGARPYYERALAIRQEVLGGRHPLTAGSLNDLGMLLQATGDLAGARPYLEQALAIHQEVLGDRHPDTARSLNNLGLLLQATGNLAGAASYYGRALAIWQEVLGERHPDTAVALNNVGRLLHDMGDLAGARPYLERALAIRQEVLGERHPDTVQSLNNLGGLLRAGGDLAGARSCYERALAIRLEVLGEHHPQTANSLNNLGFLLKVTGDLAGARPYYERALAIRQKVLGEAHPDTAQSLNNLGMLLRDMGDLAGARDCLERAAAIFAATLGPNHPRTRAARGNLAAF